MPSSRSGSHSLTTMNVGGSPATSASVANSGHASGLRASNSSIPYPIAPRLPCTEMRMPFVLRGRRQTVLRPLAGDVRAQRVQAADQPDVAVGEQLQAGGQREVAAAALAGDHDVRRRRCRVRQRCRPATSGRTRSRPGRRGTVRPRAPHDGVSALRNSTIATATPSAAIVLPHARYMPSKQTQRLHAAAVDVVHARNGLRSRRADRAAP